MTAPAKRAGRPRRGAGGGLTDVRVGLRRRDVEAIERAAPCRPGATPADLRSELIALGAAAMLAGGRIEPARAVLPTAPT